MLSRTALPQEVPEGQQAADAEQVQPEAALPVNADMAELRARLAGAEAAGVATQAEIQRVKEVLGARVTILEGTVRFLEGGSPHPQVLAGATPIQCLQSFGPHPMGACRVQAWDGKRQSACRP